MGGTNPSKNFIKIIAIHINITTLTLYAIVRGKIL